PGCYAQTDELIELAKVVAKHKGHYASHIRNEGSGLLTAIDEAIRIGREAGLPVHISHMKAGSRSIWGKSADAIALIEQARKKGQVVTADQYPYIASSTSVQAMLIPSRWREGTQKDLLARLDDSETGPKIKEGIEKLISERKAGDSIRIARYAKQPAWQGKTLAAIAKAEGKSVLDVVLEIEHNGGASAVSFGMNEEDVRLIMKQSWVATASDGSAMVPGDTVPHPRSYGTFPRKLALYSLELKIVPLEQAIRSASGLPADILRLTDRGYLKPGQAADIVVFDPKTFRDTATFDKPHQYATGVKYLFVNGKPVIEADKYNGARAGKVLRMR
ncbi:MAG: amidohydrolase family protein, partial [Gemmataceae bacterium]